LLYFLVAEISRESINTDFRLIQKENDYLPPIYLIRVEHYLPNLRFTFQKLV